MGRFFLAIQAFFAVLFRGVIPVAALPAPDDLPATYLEGAGKSKELEGKVEALTKERDEAQGERDEARKERDAGGEAKTSLETDLASAKSDAEQASKDLTGKVSAAEATSAEAEKKAASLEERVTVLTTERDAAKSKLGESRDDGALALLAWLQREGRLIDFLQEDVDDYEDEQIGAAVRAIHKGCRKVLDEGFALERILEGEEESPVEVPVGFDPVSISLSGKVSGDPPFKGTLMHHGWRSAAVKVPVSETVDTKVLAAAEVEL
ncbi:MAG: DUF2760 domain-containing protein [Planctomycetes bacterium]|nr:DUF2760 domain-containing protein [Planctomycetota bacterium]